MTTPTVFISYSHDSPEHADRVLALADRLRQDGIDCTIDQYETAPAEGWPKWMDRQIAKSDFVILVCTETYYRRVMGEEEPGKGRGVKWESTLTYQHIYDDDSKMTRFIPVLFESGKDEYIPTPLRGATYYYVQTERGYEDLLRRLSNQPRVTKPELGKPLALAPRERKPDYLGIKISTAKLPSTSPDLFGRDQELALLDAAWGNSPSVILRPAKRAEESQSFAAETLRRSAAQGDKVNVLTLVAWGGVGKTALVNRWLTQLARDNYRGAECVFGWSFYSQGAAEGRQVSADPFIAAALTWFGDSQMAESSASPWDKGERLAELVRQQRTLLVLDGLEPLQNPPPVETGCIKDPGLRALLRELARQNPGLVVITTRLAVDDLKDWHGTSVIERDLENLSTEAGAAYLAHLGVQGTPAELARAAGEFGGHALALTLLGGHLVDLHDGDIRKRDLIPPLTEEEELGGHAKRIMQAYEKWFEGKPERNILYIMGLFDRPAEKGAIEALLAAPPIPGLTTELYGIAPEKWQLALKHLRKVKLLSDKDRNDPDTLDCHPLLREHFGEQLRTSDLKAWREAHSRLYEYYKSHAKELPDTIEEMAPLFAAVAHGCLAGRHQEALDEVYWKRIQRGQEHFNWKKLGAFGADLATLSGFFVSLWDKPVDGLKEDAKSFVLNQAGLYLRALGRLAESAQPMQASLESYIAREGWKNAALVASNLSELYLTLGEVRHALDAARQSVELADRSGYWGWRMGFRTTFADALHQAGRLAEAEAAFREAEEIQKASQKEFSLLYSLPGFRYCDLLLSQGKVAEVQRRVGQTIEIARRNKWLLDIALDHLSLGRAHLLQAQVGAHRDAPLRDAATYLDRAVDGLRQARAQEFIARGLLARAELRRVTGELDKARRDLDEAFSIATHSGMRLFEADCHLEYARLHQACGEKTQARESLAKAKTMIEEMGYHRRDQEVKELEGRLS